ncbi:hypothetical protein PR003_g23252 [Phytophthora rubi]|uniref:Uncharacterized protein n=1 Tax=Phytophthora rubi TaxID=129364 RepID=A0A6A3IF71_9STRA|nr:hypothetical protein PR002_g24043 [Phytophthora rubi]KAE8982411.1 hypothetical protein PR001_g23735 [Phytophthora rubi]KAE9298393.1 hypothetical protein PR003_g23252 [Phytophthora rubi]
MVFTEISALVQSQWHALRGAFDAEGHERRVQLRHEKKQAKQQRKAARRAARAARKTQRKQRHSLLSPTVVAEPTDDEARPEPDANAAGRAWARTAEALTHAKDRGERRGASPERVEAAADVAASAVAQAVGPQIPAALALQLEAQLEQKQREFYDSLGGYSTVDEEDDELHELRAPKWAAAGFNKAADERFFKLPEEPQEQEEAAPESAKKPRPKTLSSSSELVDTEPEDDAVDLRDSDGYSTFDEAEAETQDLFIAEHEFDGLCAPPTSWEVEVVESKVDPNWAGVETEQELGVEDEEKAAVCTENKELLAVAADSEELETKQPPMDHIDEDVLEAAEPLGIKEEPVEPESEEEMELIEGVEEVTEVEVDTEEGAEVLEGVEEVVVHEVEQPVDEDMFGQQTSLPLPVPELSSTTTPGVYSPGTVDEYACSIYENLRAREHRYHVTEDIFAKQQSVEPKMRAVLVDWLVEVHQRFELEAQTLFLTVNYIDRYLAQVPVKSQRFQLVGVAALLIASKFEEIYPCDMDDLLYICERSYSKADLVDCERDLLNSYKFNLAVPSASSFLGYYLEHFEEEDEVIGQLASYFAECSLLDFAFGAKYEPSIVACACLLAAYCYIENQTPALVWNYRLEELTGYAVEAILPCAQDLWPILIEPSDLTAVATKYSAKEFGEVAHLPLEELEALLY